ncbi:MAG: hypothetical protein HZB66_00455, partial [Candidatus Aenigmarchaeota archaeon]|nr:hypothetical protein [Candidatus Aenigmarchaeota archaeon]
TDGKNAQDDTDFMHACEALYGKGIKGAQCLWYCECGLEVDTCKLNCNICKADAKEKASCIALLKNKYPNCACS